MLVGFFDLTVFIFSDALFIFSQLFEYFHPTVFSKRCVDAKCCTFKVCEFDCVQMRTTVRKGVNNNCVGDVEVSLYCWLLKFAPVKST